jgi:hypothetical protein
VDFTLSIDLVSSGVTCSPFRKKYMFSVLGLGCSFLHSSSYTKFTFNEFTKLNLKKVYCAELLDATDHFLFVLIVVVFFSFG